MKTRVAMLALLALAGCGLFCPYGSGDQRERPELGREVVEEDLTAAGDEFRPSMILDEDDLPLLAGARPRRRSTVSEPRQVDIDDTRPESGEDLAASRNPPSYPPGTGERPAVEWLDFGLEALVMAALALVMTTAFCAVRRFPKSSMVVVGSAGLGAVLFVLLSR